VAPRRRFGVSTRLYQRHRLSRDHLLDIAAHGFETVEVVADRTHVDFANPAVVADLQQWLAEAGMDLASVAAPGGTAIEEIEQALFIARRIPMTALVLPVGPPREAARTVDRLAALAAPLGVTVAIDSRSESMTPIGSLVHFVETTEGRAGICLDFAAAHRAGDLVDAIEAAAEHLVAARLPIDSGIDWSSALTTVQKVGYEGAFVFEAEPAGAARDTLARAKRAREKMQRWLTSI
jgi:sugar phosphate isomerase/epimerase